MTGLSTRAGLVAGACLVQAVLVPAAVWPQLSARVTGQEYLLEVAPLDPIDPFRGAYVMLDYPGLSTAAVTGAEDLADGAVYHRLVPAGEVWVGDGPAVAQRPESGPYLTCVVEDRSTSCGIESFFAAQEEALRLEQKLQGGALARVRIDGRGNAAVVGIEAR